MKTAESRRLLREVTRMHACAQRVLAERNSMTITQCQLLIEIEHSGTLPLSELGKRVCLEKSRVSRAVEALAVRGLVVKKADPADARILLVTLTDEGVRMMSDLNVTLHAHARQFLACLSERDRAAVVKALSRLLTALEQKPFGP